MAQLCGYWLSDQNFLWVVLLWESHTSNVRSPVDKRALSLRYRTPSARARASTRLIQLFLLCTRSLTFCFFGCPTYSSSISCVNRIHRTRYTDLSNSGYRIYLSDDTDLSKDVDLSLSLPSPFTAVVVYRKTRISIWIIINSNSSYWYQPFSNRSARETRYDTAARDGLERMVVV